MNYSGSESVLRQDDCTRLLPPPLMRQLRSAAHVLHSGCSARLDIWCRFELIWKWVFTLTPAVKGRTETAAATLGPNEPNSKKRNKWQRAEKSQLCVIVREINSERYSHLYMMNNRRKSELFDLFSLSHQVS